MGKGKQQIVTAQSVTLTSRLDVAVERAVGHLLSRQFEEGYWWGELESNVTITAEHLFLTHILGLAQEKEEEWRKIANYLREQQRKDGTWANWYDGPGDLSTTIEAYLALKLAGVSSEDPAMGKAREFILAQGGVERARGFTKIWLAMLGEWDWRGTPVLPPELVLLPKWFPINIYAFACWARGTIVPMSIILSRRPVFPLPKWAHIDELFIHGKERADLSLARKNTAWGRVFSFTDKLLRSHARFPIGQLQRLGIKRAEELIIHWQEADGSWGGIQPPWVYSLIALKLLGYGLNHPVMKKGLSGFYGEKGFAIEDEETFHLQSCLSPVWDTGLAMIGLENAGLPPDHPALVKAGNWLLKEQIFTDGDWQVHCNARPGGWAFEFSNNTYPDTDDTAIVMLSLLEAKLDPKEKGRSLARGLEWLLAMQSRNGGWGAFDRNNTRALLREIPFADFGEMIDPPSVDVTAHIVELLGELGHRRGFRPLDKAIDYLTREQEEDGAWFGRWGVNTIYGTGCVLPALAAVREDMSAPYIQRAVNWLIQRQNDDGGWGEKIISYVDRSWRGKGPSTASQTAWALLALIAACEEWNPATKQGIAYLIETQQESGGWEEPYFTGTGFPMDFMINYHLYRDVFPLWALSLYRAAVGGRG